MAPMYPVHKDCPICTGKGFYVSKTSTGKPINVTCQCTNFKNKFQTPNIQHEMCLGEGWTEWGKGSFPGTGAVYVKRLCKCVTGRGTYDKKEVEGEPRNTDWQTDYSHWPGPTLTSFVVDVKLDGKKDGKGDWIVAGRSDDHRKQRFHIDAIEMTQVGGNSNVFQFVITATELDGIGGGYA